MTQEQLEKELKKIWKRICCNSGTSSFESLTDGPGDFTGNELEFIRVNAAGTALEYVPLAGGGDALTTDPLSQFASTTSAQLAGVLSDETGTGLAVFNTSPLLVTPRLAATSTIGYVWTATDGSGNGSFQAASGGMTNPLTTTGDIIYSSSGSTPARLGIGATNEFLTVQGGVPVWDSINLVVTPAPAGTGQYLLYDIGTDILYHRSVKGSTYINVTTSVDDVVVSLNVTGTPDGTKFLRDDGSWAVASGGSGITLLNGLSGGTQTFATGTTGTDFGISSSGTTHTFNIPDAGASARGVITTGTQTIAGAKNFSSSILASGGLNTASNAVLGNFWAIGSNAATTTTNSQHLVEGASGIGLRAAMYGSSATAITANYAYGNLVIANTPVTEASSGTHPLIASLIVRGGTVTGAAGATANLATVYIDGPMTGVTPTTGTYALWIKAGDTLLTNGNLSLGTAGNKINITTGSNASIGVSAAMTAGSITISTTAVTASSKIFLTHASVAGTQGILSVGTITAGTSFVINSSNAADTGTVNWWIIN